MITPSQCRASRALLNWSQQNLADAAKVGVVAVRQFEKEQATPRSATLQVIRSALEAAGVIFLAEGETTAGGPGVRVKA